MTSRATSFLLAILALFIAATIAAPTAYAQVAESFGEKGDTPSITSVPRSMSYQGILQDSAGDPVADSVYDVTFRIFNLDSGGSSLWDETLPCTTTAGVFNAMFSNVNLPFDEDYWLELEVDTEILDPRQKMSMSAYAAVSDTADFAERVGTVDGATGGTISGDVNIQSDLSVDGDISATGKATIGPGHTNTGTNAFVAGEANTSSGNQSTVGGGAINTASGLQSTVSGGYAGLASGESSTIGGGWHNLASGSVATVAGGQEDTASGTYATVPGGYRNSASGAFSLACGNRAKANHNGSFVWGDATPSDFPSTGDNQFLIRASGGVGIGTNNPTSALHVNGEAKSVVAGVNFYMVPQGAIIMWSGTLASIPGGWALCDGTSGTPDLRNRFIYGVNTGENPGATGGATSHYHNLDIGPFASAANGSSWLGANIGVSLVPTYNHGHIIDPPPTNSNTQNHLPPYFKLAFIMKL